MNQRWQVRTVVASVKRNPARPPVIIAAPRDEFLLWEEWTTFAKTLKDAITVEEHPLTHMRPADLFQALALLFTHDRRLKHLASLHRVWQHPRYRARRPAGHLQAIFSSAAGGVQEGREVRLRSEQLLVRGHSLSVAAGTTAKSGLCLAR